MYSRTGKELKCPESYKLHLPPLALDGELWVKRGLQQSALQLSRSRSEDLWKSSTFCIFDAPNQNKPYEDRVQFLKKLQKDSNWPKFLSVVEPIQCKSREHLKEFMKEIIDMKGEGVMLREPQSLYEAGRSKSMRRYKEFKDTEVLVVKNMYPHGLECQQ